MDMANGDVFTYCFLKHFLTFLCLPPEREQRAESQDSGNDTASLEQLVQKCDKEKPIRLLHGSRGKEVRIFFYSALEPECSRAVVSGSH